MSVLILNHTHIECGVYQFGKRVYDLASRSDKVEYFYKNVSSKEQYLDILNKINPEYIVYNWHWDRMPWLKEEDITGNKNAKHYFIYHDGSMMKNYDKYLFFGDYDSDRKAVPEDKRVLLPRPLFEYNGSYPKNNVVTIGSFGFAFNHKRFPELVTLINNSFDKAIINLHMPNPYFGNTKGNVRDVIVKSCKKSNRKPGIEINIDTKFSDDNQLLSFLAQNDINVFYYGKLENPGLSSAFDYALSVKRPIAITENIMFRHIASDDILLTKHSIQEILDKGTAPLERFYKDWSVDNFTLQMEKLFL
jgi:hypothetical protein